FARVGFDRSPFRRVPVAHLLRPRARRPELRRQLGAVAPARRGLCGTGRTLRRRAAQGCPGRKPRGVEACRFVPALWPPEPATRDAASQTLPDVSPAAPPRARRARRRRAGRCRQWHDEPDYVQVSPAMHTATGKPMLADAEEVDLWWGGFATRSMVLSFSVC